MEAETVVETGLGKRSIAVLPFINISRTEEDEIFSDGITDDILAHLCKIGDMNVIARTSSMQYKETDKCPREIGRELGVATLLEGSVRRYGNKVRIVAQLVEARTGKHLWADDYDRDLTDIFAIQSDVARQIAAALKATLTPEEKSYIEEKPTDNTEAYEYYLRGNAFFDMGQINREKSIGMYEKAVEQDPTFAVAYARLTRGHLLMYGLGSGYDHTEERLAKAKSALDKAQALDPDHPEVHLAYGYYYYRGFRDYARALEHFYLALRKQPNNSDIINAISVIHRRQGQWEAAAANGRKAADLDPRSHIASNVLLSSYLYMRNWAEAERFADRCIFISPGTGRSYPGKANIYLRSNGDIERARGVMEAALEIVDPSELGRLVNTRSYIEILARDYQKALDIVEADTADWFLRKADIYRYLGQPGSCRAYYDSARVTYEERVRNDPDSYAAHGNLGIAYAGLGRREEAIREGKLAVEILPLSRDALGGTTRILTLAEIYTMLGENDAAIDQLEVLLSIPSEISVPLLRIDPQWDSLREHPRFKKLVAG